MARAEWPKSDRPELSTRSSEAVDEDDYTMICGHRITQGGRARIGRGDRDGNPGRDGDGLILLL